MSATATKKAVQFLLEHDWIFRQLSTLGEMSRLLFEKAKERGLSEEVTGELKEIIGKYKKKVDSLRSSWWFRWFVRPVLQCQLCAFMPVVVECGLNVSDGLQLASELPNLLKKSLAKLANILADVLPDLSLRSNGRGHAAV